jgi:hypothetical protein
VYFSLLSFINKYLISSIYKHYLLIAKPSFFFFFFFSSSLHSPSFTTPQAYITFGTKTAQPKQ